MVVRVGLVGADAAGKGWGATAHVPALEAAGGIELSGVCTRSAESATRASAKFGVPGFHDVSEMAAHPDIDLVCVVVKVPGHADAVTAALEAGKHVYSEWPLGLDRSEAERLAKLAREKGVVSGVGLQGRHTPELNTAKTLIDEGYLGELFSVDVRWLTRGPARGEESPGVPGASMFAVGGGHTLDIVQHLFGPFASFSARTDVPRGVEPHEIRDVAAHGALESGGLVSYRMTVVPSHVAGWRLEARGTEGTLVASTNIMPQISPVTLMGAKGDSELAPIPTRDEFVAVPDAPPGPPRNVSESYARLAKAISDGSRYRADFDDAVALHKWLDEIRGVS